MNTTKTVTKQVFLHKTFYFTPLYATDMSSVKKMVVDWKGNLRFDSRNEKGLTVSIDVPKDHGGEETALSPTENLLASLAACTSIGVLGILKKKRQNVTDYSVEVTAEKREDPPPRVFTKIHLKYKIKGENLSSQAVETAIKLSEEKYCAVGEMLKKSVEITSSFEIQ